MLPILRWIASRVANHWSSIQLMLDYSLRLLALIAYNLWLASALLQMFELLLSLSWLEHQWWLILVSLLLLRILIWNSLALRSLASRLDLRRSPFHCLWVFLVYGWWVLRSSHLCALWWILEPSLVRRLVSCDHRRVERSVLRLGCCPLRACATRVLGLVTLSATVCAIDKATLRLSLIRFVGELV